MTVGMCFVDWLTVALERYVFLKTAILSSVLSLVRSIFAKILYRFERFLNRIFDVTDVRNWELKSN